MQHKKQLHVEFGMRHLLLRRAGETTGVRVYEGTVTLTGHEGLTYDYVVEVGLVDESARSRVVAKSIRVASREGGAEVTSRRVGRELGEAKWTAVAALAMHVDETGRARPRPWRKPSASDIRSAMAGASSGPAPVPLSDIERAAKVYRDAASKGRGTTKAVAAALQVSPSTARKRAGQARKAGLLPTATSTRPKL